MAVARAIRDIVPMAGLGGEIEVYTPAYNQEVMGPTVLVGRKLEIDLWRMEHTMILADGTHSGSNGALLYYKVAHGFIFQLNIPWNAMFRELRDDASFGFMEQLLGGIVATDYACCVKFNLGDPSQWTGGNRAFYYAPRCKLEKVITVTDNSGKQIIRMEVHGRGHSLLRGYHGDELKFGGEDASSNLIPGLAG